MCEKVARPGNVARVRVLYVCPPRSTRQPGEVVARVADRPGVDVTRCVATCASAYEVLFFTCAQFRSYVLVCCELTDG